MGYAEEGCNCVWCRESRGGVSVPEDAQEEAIVEAEIALGVNFTDKDVEFVVGGTPVIVVQPLVGEFAKDFLARLARTTETIEATIDAMNEWSAGED